MVKYTYDAWGKPLSCTGTMAASLGKLNPFRYRGYVFDEETGLYYLTSRYYSPNRYRFLNADLICAGGRTNSFTFCDNTPIGFVDKSGTSPIPVTSQDEENFLLFLDAYKRSTKKEYEHYNGDPTTEWTEYRCIIETNYSYTNTSPISENVSKGITIGGAIIAGIGVAGTILSMTKVGQVASTIATYLGGIASAIGIYDVVTQDPIRDSDEYVHFTIIYYGISERPYYKDFSYILTNAETKIMSIYTFLLGKTVDYYTICIKRSL